MIIKKRAEIYRKSKNRMVAAKKDLIAVRHDISHSKVNLNDPWAVNYHELYFLLQRKPFGAWSASLLTTSFPILL